MSQLVRVDGFAEIMRGNVSGASSDEHLADIWLDTFSSAGTRRSYALDSAMFLGWIVDRGLTLRTLTVAGLTEYAAQLPGGVQAQARRLASAKSLLSFGRRTGYLVHDVGAVVPLPRRPVDLAKRMLSERETDELLAAATGRLRGLLFLLYATGARISEALALTWADVHPQPDGAAVVSIVGKGQRLRHVRIEADVVDALGPRGAGFLFPTATGRAMTQPGADREIRRLGKAVLAKNISAHWLRHAHVSHALTAGAPTHLVQHTVGHASPTMTARYAHARPDLSSCNFIHQTERQSRAFQRLQPDFHVALGPVEEMTGDFVTELHALAAELHVEET